MEQPLVSLILPVRDEARFIERNLDALAAQTYPHDCLEILVADGQSTDGTPDKVRAFAAAHGGLSIRLLDNPQRIKPPGFNMALAEAMLCGCVPLVTDRGALPEVAGPGALVAPYGDLALYACALERALAAGPEAGEAARRRIAAEYPLERRREALLEILEEVREEARADGPAIR